LEFFTLCANIVKSHSELDEFSTVKGYNKALEIRKIKKIKNNNDETRKVALLMVLGEPLGLLRLAQNDLG
jgi:hypothetical protein